MTYDIRSLTDLLDADAYHAMMVDSAGCSTAGLPRPGAKGCRRIVADTVTRNLPMLSLCESCGFQRVERCAGNLNPPDLNPFLVYLEKTLPQANR